jgi:hypothetical protein
MIGHKKSYNPRFVSTVQFANLFASLYTGIKVAIYFYMETTINNIIPKLQMMKALTDELKK